MTPEIFSATFDRIIKKRAREVRRHCASKREFTAFLLDGKRRTRSVCQQVADALDLKYCDQYYRSDAVMFKKRDKKHFPDDFYAEYLSVVIEAENEARLAKDEVSKLMTLDAPLRVLITYPPPQYRLSLLPTWTKIVTNADWARDASRRGRLLVICGFLKNNPPRWEYLTYRAGRFVPMTTTLTAPSQSPGSLSKRIKSSQKSPMG